VEQLERVEAKRLAAARATFRDAWDSDRPRAETTAEFEIEEVRRNFLGFLDFL